MKKNYLKLIAICGLSVISLASNAQLDDVTKILNGGVGDAGKLVSAYMGPYGKGFALGLSNGWYNTAKPHKLFGFDLTLTATMVSIPTSDQTYSISSLGLTTLTAGTKNISPTIAGENSGAGNVVLKLNPSLPSKTIELPVGTGFAYVPAAMVQLGFGLPFGTEIMGRFLPTIKIGDFGKLGMWGIGLKHDLKQWIPVISETPFWSLSAMAGYTKFKTSATGTFLTPDANSYYMTGVNLSNYNNQGVELAASAFTANLLVSTDIPIINAYAGLGFVSTNSTLALKGIYPLPGVPNATDVANSVANGETVKLGVKNSNPDPINADLISGTDFRANIGIRLKLAIITFHADAGICGGYTLYTGGFGISFR